MKKTVKIVLWGLLALISLVIVSLLALPVWIGSVVTTVANSVAPGYTGTEFKLESFSLNPYSGKIRVGSVKLSNPKGYDEKTAFSVRSVSIDFDTCSLFSDKIHISDITIEDPFVSYVFDDAGSNNFERIMASVQAKTGPAEEKEEAEEDKAKSGKKKVIIDRLAINGTSVKYRMIKLPIPIPTLTNIGKDSDGATAEEVGMTVWASIKDKFTGVGGMLGGAMGGAVSGATDALKNATSVIGGTAEGATKAAAEGAKVVGEGAKTAINAVGDGAKAATQVMGDGAKVATQAVGDGAKATVNAVGDGAKATVNAVGEGAKAAADGAKDALKKVGNLFGK